MDYLIPFSAPDRFAGWPANNGLWAWGDEILVGCSLGAFEAQTGHSVSGSISSMLLRSVDGGVSWTSDVPENYLNDPRPLRRLTQPLNFSGNGFAMRIIGTGYHGTEEPRGGFFASNDHGHSWRGPFSFYGLQDHPLFQGWEMTPRTDYLVGGSGSCLAFLSVRDPISYGSDRVFCASTADGGQAWRFVAWVVSPDDPHRAVMPSTVRCSDRHLVSAIRRRDMKNGQCPAWIDAYVSKDNGRTWTLSGRVGETGCWNGNPPALVRLHDGRLCCVFGNRTRRQMIARFSCDLGESWGEEQILRDDFFSIDAEPDFGYPRLMQRSDGALIAFYYWATETHPQQHIAATVWMQDETG